jgi:hypothetical protein
MIEKLRAWLIAIVKEATRQQFEAHITCLHTMADAHQASIEYMRRVLADHVSSVVTDRNKDLNSTITPFINKFEELTLQVQAVHERISAMTTFQQYEAVHVAAEKLSEDNQFWDRADKQKRLEKVFDMALIYLYKNGWDLPDSTRLFHMVSAKLDQLETRKVGPKQ